jgi:hypothetical protein
MMLADLAISPSVCGQFRGHAFDLAQIDGGEIAIDTLGEIAAVSLDLMAQLLGARGSSRALKQAGAHVVTSSVALRPCLSAVSAPWAEADDGCTMPPL